MISFLFYGCIFTFFFTQTTTFRMIRYKLKSYQQIESSSIYFYSKSFPPVKMTDMSDLENSGFSFYKATLNNKLNLTSFSGCDMRFINMNITKLVNKETTADKMINESINLDQENQDVVNIKKYLAMNDLLNVLKSPNYANTHKLTKIYNSTFLPDFSREIKEPNMYSAGLLDDWNWDIE